MTSRQVDPTVGAQETATTAVFAVIKPMSGVTTVARRSVAAVQGTAGRVAALLPGTIRATRAGAHEATSALHTLPDPTLRSLAASSVGLGVGFYLAGAPRLVVAAGVVPALIMGTAIAVRPVDLAPTEAAR